MKRLRTVLLALIFGLTCVTVQKCAAQTSYIWTASGLPAGITLTQTGPSAALVSGIPTTAGSYPVVINACDASNPSNCGTLASTVVITPAPLPISINPKTLPPGTVKQPYSVPLSAATGVTGSAAPAAAVPNDEQ